MKIMNKKDECIKALARGLLPDPIMTVSEWADEFRILDNESSAEPGRFKTSRTPYVREPADRLGSYDPVKTVVLCFGSQLGKTEICHNWIGYTASISPVPMMTVQPTVEMAKLWSKGRVGPMIDLSPDLKSKFADPKARDGSNTVFYKKFTGGALHIKGSNSPSGLASTPISRVIMDEVDRYEESIGSEGSPIKIIEQRMSSFPRSKSLMTSTPLLKSTSVIWKYFLLGDQRYYYVPCPECGKMQNLIFDNLYWRHTGNPRDAEYKCVKCGSLIPEHKKTKMLSEGEWRATADFNGDITSYHINALYAPYGWSRSSWPSLAKEFLMAGKDPQKLQPFHNTKLSLTFDDIGGSRIQAEDLVDKAEDLKNKLSERAKIITIGVDIQDDRIELTVVAWGKGEEMWIYRHIVIDISPDDTDSWKQLELFLKRNYAGRRVVAACIDSGGHYTDRVYQFCSKNIARYRGWYAINGVSGEKKMIWPKKPSTSEISKNFNSVFYSIGVDPAKWIIHQRIRKGIESGPGAAHFGKDCDENYFKQLTSEVRRFKFVNGSRVNFWWKKKDARNEALDCLVYAYAALNAWLTKGIPIDGDGNKAGRVFKPINIK